LPGSTPAAYDGLLNQARLLLLELAGNPSIILLTIYWNGFVMRFQLTRGPSIYQIEEKI
jgi:hypothetical protein